MAREIQAGGVWLLTTDNRLRVLVEVDGVWRIAIDEARPFNADQTPLIMSHCAHAGGVSNWKPWGGAGLFLNPAPEEGHHAD